jgi:hypothetical protein
MPRMHPQLSPMMQAPPPTGCTGKAPPPPLPPVAPPEVVGDGAPNTVEEGLFALLSDAPARSTPHPSAKATTAAPPHHAAAILALRFITRSMVIRLSRVRISHTAAAVERFSRLTLAWRTSRERVATVDLDANSTLIITE